MNSELTEIFLNGENSLTEFKEPSVSPQTLAEEISAFANVMGGDIYIGVSDDGRVTGIDSARIKNLEQTAMNICRNSILPPLIPLFETIRFNDKLIARIRVPEGIEKPYQTASGKYMIRVGSTKRNSSREELLRMFQNARVYHIDANPVAGSEKKDLDLDKISAYFRDVYDLETRSMDQEEFDSLLVNASIATRFHAGLCASLSGLLFFGLKQKLGSALETHLPHAGIQFVAYEDDDLGSIIDRLDCYETSPESVDAVIHKIRLNWKTSSLIKGLKREELTFPEGIFRELVVNAIVHRDYSIRGKIRIKMAGFKFHLAEYEESFSASLEFP
ncbi:MAG: hypothetical protein A2277_17820 [Desulfobacterales bacterium RIFOXYA12_FULL_46_15]|nr:MAG: hypothetical protein A2277_17820 [Desulfobacterales bacterium RIFOXYA12_FULL_46_15]